MLDDSTEGREMEFDIVEYHYQLSYYVQNFLELRL